jgi:hypothetical protein
VTDTSQPVWTRAHGKTGKRMMRLPVSFGRSRNRNPFIDTQACDRLILDRRKHAAAGAL